MQGSSPARDLHSGRPSRVLRDMAALACHAVLAALAVSCLSCGQGAAPPVFAASDLCPPVLSGFEVLDARNVSVEFDEDAAFKEGSLALYREGDEPVAPEAISGSPGTSLGIAWPEDLAPGAEYRLEGRAEDGSGNSLSFYVTFYGHNPRPPLLVVNEVRTDSSDPKCDLVEFYVKRGGWSGGLCACAGTRGDYEWRYLFPPLELSSGEYLVLHLEADPEGEGRDETGNALDASGGPDACPAARDLWYPGQATLPKSNGVLALYLNPAGPLMDALLYSDRSAQSDERYGGFGSSKLRDRVASVVEEGGWLSAGSVPCPEDCASSAGTTSTRTICRAPDSADTDSRSDWHVVPTKGSSFGAANAPESYQPATAGRRGLQEVKGKH